MTDDIFKVVLFSGPIGDCPGCGGQPRKIRVPYSAGTSGPVRQLIQLICVEHDVVVAEQWYGD